MTETNQEPSREPSPLDKVVRRAIAAGLTTREEAAQALIQLEYAKIPHERLADLQHNIRKEAEREAEETARDQPPQDEQELLEWITSNMQLVPWVKEAKCLALTPYGNFQAVIRVVNDDNYTFRLGISYSQDEENEAEFDETFLE